MESLRDIAKQFKQSSEDTTDRNAELISIMKDISLSLNTGFNRLEKSLSNIKVTTSPFRLRIPGLASLRDALTNNPVVNALSSLKSGIIGAVTAPFALVQAAIVGIKDTFISVFKGFGNIIMAPFRFISNAFSNLFKRKENETLKSIYDKLQEIDDHFNDYFKYLKRKDLDKLEEERESRIAAPEREDLTPQRKSLKERIDGAFEFIKGLPAMIGGFLSGVLGAFSVAIIASLTGFDDALRLIRLPKIKIPKFEFITKIKDWFTPITEGGTKLGEVLGKVGKFFKTLLKPFGFILKFLRANPITGIILSVIDGLVGFVKGFMGADGSFTDKLLGGLEGAVLGIITGITDAIDLLIFKIPAWIFEKLGLEKAAEFLRGLSLTKLVENVYFGVKSLFENGGEGFRRLAQNVKDFFGAQVKRVSDFITDSFNNVTLFFRNIPDRIISAFGKFFSFEIPTLSIPKPDWLGGGEFVLLKGFKLGGGNLAAAAEKRIAARESAMSEPASSRRVRREAPPDDRGSFRARAREAREQRRLDREKYGVLSDERTKAREQRRLNRENGVQPTQRAAGEDLRNSRLRNNRGDSLASGAVTQAQLKRDVMLNNAPVVNTNIDGRTTQNNTTVLNQGSLPSTVDFADKPVF